MPRRRSTSIDKLDYVPPEPISPVSGGGSYDDDLDEGRSNSQDDLRRQRGGKHNTDGQQKQANRQFSTVDPARSILAAVADHQRLKASKAILKGVAFTSALLNCLCAGSIAAYSLYAPLFLQKLGYSQYHVNAISTTAEVAVYLPVPLFGWLCDRYSPRPLSASSGVFFALGYGLAAATYNQQGRWSVGVMVAAFVFVGFGTCTMYLSAVATSAKNFGRGKHKGLALAVPIAAFGLSGLWQSQVGSHFFRDDEGDIDVTRYFTFLAVLLGVVGLLGGVCLTIVDEEELIEETVDELERSGYWEDRPFLRRALSREESALAAAADGGSAEANERQPLLRTGSVTTAKSHQNAGMAIDKNVLLNAETRLFVTDKTMWLLTLGFFLTTGPGEMYVMNAGSLLHTLYPSSVSLSHTLVHGIPSSNSPAAHVSIIAATSTIARLVTGTISDIFAPIPTNSSASQNLQMPPQDQPRSTFRRVCCSFTISRIAILVTMTILFSAAHIILSTDAVSNNPKLLELVSTLVGLGYGAIFSLVPIVIAVVWGVGNFATNWSIVAVVPAAGAALCGAIYSTVYQRALAVDTSGGTSPISVLRTRQLFFPTLIISSSSGGESDATLVARHQCHGVQCYRLTFILMAIMTWLAILAWTVAWRVWKRRGIAI